MPKLYPARDYVIIELEEQADKRGHLYIPETAKDAPMAGFVTAVGPGTEEEHPTAKVGDKVLFARYSGADLEWEGKKLLLIRESEIICYIKED
jgi:chaperonin GroES